MKKLVCLSLSFCLILTLFCGCNNNNDTQSNYSEVVITEEVVIDNTTNTSNDAQGDDNMSSATDIPSKSEISTSSDDISSKTDPQNCSHKYNETIEQTAQLFKAGTKKYSCQNCGDSYTKEYTLEKLKILAIGNSFSLNSMWELYPLLKHAGVKEIDIAIMYIGGCSLDQHWENAQNNSANYQLYRNNSGSWKITDNYSLETILQEGGWDIITLQNKSEHAAEQSMFSNLDNMVNYVNGKCPDAKILWHMTWAFTKDSKYLNTKYDKDDTLMFKNITDCVQNIVTKNQKIHSIVPVGTAVMNARTSKLSDSVNQEDGSHLSEDIGYYVGAYTWFSAITGMSVYDVDLSAINFGASQNADIICESVQNALNNPYQITQSHYKN